MKGSSVDIARLYELQKIDTHLDKVRRRVAQIRQKLGEPQELLRARAAVDESAVELEQVRARQLDADLNARQLLQRIQESEKRMMSGQVRNAKELEALQSSIESMKRQHSQTDDVALAALQRNEELQQLLAGQQAVLSRLESDWQTQSQALEQEELKYRRMYSQLKQQRQGMTERLDGAALALYSQLQERKAGVAVAAVQNGLCSACNVSLPTGVVSNARIVEGMPVYCPSCGRVLFAS